MTPELEAGIELLADWWVEACRANGTDNGDAATSAFGSFAKSTTPETPENVWPKLRAALITGITLRVVEWPDVGGWHFDTDYGPGGALARAGEESGLGAGMLRWPWKTNTSLYPDGHVEVSAGYGAEWITVSP